MLSRCIPSSSYSFPLGIYLQAYHGWPPQAGAGDAVTASALAGTPVGHTRLARCSEDSAGCPASTAAPRRRMDESAKAMQQAIARSITAGSPELFQEVSRSSHAHGQAEERPRCIKITRTRSGTGGSVLGPVRRLCRADWCARGGIPLNCTQALICLRQRCQQTISKCRQGRSAPCPER